AAVLRIPRAGALGHVVISDGAGGTVEAHSTRRGVIASTLSDRRWDMGILVPGISYTKGEAVRLVNAGIVYRLADPRMTGTTVKAIQRGLGRAGFNPGPVDGMSGRRPRRPFSDFRPLADSSRTARWGRGRRRPSAFPSRDTASGTLICWGRRGYSTAGSSFGV